MEKRAEGVGGVFHALETLAELTSSHNLSIRSYKVSAPLVMPLAIDFPLITSIIFKQSLCNLEIMFGTFFF